MYGARQPRIGRAWPPLDAVRQFYRKFLFLAQNTKEGRGLRLLREWLSPAQRRQFERLGYFDVVGCSSGRLYRIYHKVMPPNVYEIDGAGRRRTGLCFAPAGPLARGDVMLAQKIALETDEQGTLAAANIIPLA